jgi:hypothetical protein
MTRWPNPLYMALGLATAPALVAVMIVMVKWLLR